MGKLLFLMCGIHRQMLARLLDGFEMPTIFREKKIILTVFTIENKSKIMPLNFLCLIFFHCSAFKVLSVFTLQSYLHSNLKFKNQH